MISAILNSAMLDSDTAILDSNTLLSSLKFTQKHSSSTLTLTQTNSNLTNDGNHDSPSWILPSWIQPFSFSFQSHSHFQRLFPLFAKKLDSFILTQLDDSAILNSAMLDSDTAILDSNTLLSSLRFTQKHSPSTLTLTQTNSIWLT